MICEKGMKVICIKNNYHTSNELVNPKGDVIVDITINKIYEVIEIYDFFGVGYYSIINDKNIEWRYDEKNFILLEEFRDGIIDKIL